MKTPTGPVPHYYSLEQQKNFVDTSIINVHILVLHVEKLLVVIFDVDCWKAHTNLQLSDDQN